MATNVSRRQFLHRFGGWATALAGLLAGALGVPESAQGAGAARCCSYHCYDVLGPGRVARYRYKECHADGSPCFPGNIGREGGCSLHSDRLVKDCHSC